MAQQLYPYDIPSISNLYPGIPAHIVHVLHLDESITSGKPISIFNATQAQGVANSLAYLKEHEQAVTDEIVETARNRAMVIRSTHGQLQFDQGGNATILARLDAMNNTLNAMNNTVNGIDQRLSRIEIVLENSRIIKRNQLLWPLGSGQIYNLRRKEVIGSGTALALELHGGIALPHDVDIHPPADLGTSPGDLNPFTATGNDIPRLVSFYNNTFGVIATDNLATRREKLVHWLTDSFF